MAKHPIPSSPLNLIQSSVLKFTDSTPMKLSTLLSLVFALFYSTTSKAMAPLGSGAFIFGVAALFLIGIILLLLMTLKFLNRVKSDCKKHDENEKG